MFEAGQGQTVTHGRLHFVAGNKPMQHARRKGIAGANPVDDSRDEDFIGCKSRVAGVDPCRNAMAVGVVQMAGGRCNRLQLREGFEGSEGCLTPPLLDRKSVV